VAWRLKGRKESGDSNYFTGFERFSAFLSRNVIFVLLCIVERYKTKGDKK
jgi:hypothetical protein